eukprot:2215274-Prymnesium_polylepis.1
MCANLPHAEPRQLQKGGMGRACVLTSSRQSVVSRLCARLRRNWSSRGILTLYFDRCAATGLPNRSVCYAPTIVTTPKQVDEPNDTQQGCDPPAHCAHMTCCAQVVCSALHFQDLLRKTNRVRALKARLEELQVRGDAKALIEDIIAVERNGKLAQRKELLNFIRDLIKSLKLGDGAHGGRRSKNMRWHESTKRIFDVILKL